MYRRYAMETNLMTRERKKKWSWVRWVQKTYQECYFIGDVIVQFIATICFVELFQVLGTILM